MPVKQPNSRDDMRPIRYAPLVLLLAALAAGLTIDRYWPLGALVWWLGGTAALAVWLPFWLYGRERIASTLLLASALSTGGAWHHDYWNYYLDDDISRLVREEIRPIVVEGLAMNSPRWVPAPPPTAMRIVPKGEESEVLLWMTAVRDRDAWRPASGWALMRVDGNLQGIRAGDRIRVMALGSQPQSPLNPSEFDYAQYERSRRIGCRLRGLFPESVTLIARGSPWNPRLWLSQVRDRGNFTLRRHITPHRATLAAAVLIGAREQLDPERNEGFLVTGTIHVLSISGLHVGILAAGFWVIFRTGLLPRRTTLVAAMLLTIAYACLTDLQPPVVRATILVVAMCLARLLGRQALGFNTLALAGIVVLALNPASLFLAGPQLSFLAVAVMIVFQHVLAPQPNTDPLDRLIATTRPWPIRWTKAAGVEVWRVWLTGALIFAVSLPLIWKQYNLISPVALILNLLMWVPISIALYAGFGVLLLGSIVPPLGIPCAWLCDGCLALTESCIELGRDLPASHWWLPAPPWWWIGGFYAVLGLVAVFPALRPRWHWSAALISVWTTGSLFLSHPALPQNLGLQPKPLVSHFVSLGHGVGVIVELPDGRTILYDAGKLGSPLGATRPVSAVLWSRGITHLDAIVISHADADHFNGIPELLDRFSVGIIYVSPYMFERRQPAVEELMAAIEARGAPLREIRAGDELRSSEGLRLRVLHPGRQAAIDDDNANSIVLSIEYAGRRLLLTGDLQTSGLADLMANEPLDCDVILAPHHGSPRSDPAGFADWSTPEYVVISGGRNVEDVPAIERVKNSFRLRGAEVFHTAEDGCVRFNVQPSGELSVSSFRPHVRATADMVENPSPAQ
jgi:competence protein ComEC